MEDSVFLERPLITIIIPVFNVEKYLRRCIDSVLLQDYRNLEIIMIDDGSTDHSGRICDEYQKYDLRIKVIHKQNGGLSDARNVGLDAAGGEYITFVDSDDWVSKDYISAMYRWLVKTDSDLAIGNWIRATKDGIQSHGCNEVYEVHNREAAVKELLYQRLSTSAWCKLYKKELWQGVRFPSSKLYEDVEPVYLIFHKCNKIVHSKRILYFYYLRSGSIVNQKFSAGRMDYVENCKKILEKVKKDYPELKQAAVSRLFWAEVHVLVHMDAPEEYLREYALLINDIKRNRVAVIRDRENKLIVRIVAGLSFGGYRTLKLVYKLVMRVAA